MNQLTSHLKQRKKYLLSLQAKITTDLTNMPEGTLRIATTHNKPYYYHRKTSADRQGTYIPRKDESLAQKLAQKDYLHRLQREIKNELNAIDHFLASYKSTALEDIYANLTQSRRTLIDPLILPDDLFITNWLNEPFISNPYYEEQKIYPTHRGEMVRSKSEVLIADMYYEMGIPYRYEAPLELRCGKIKYPDFTLLNPKTCRMIYHEHLGLLDNPEYLQANLMKLNEYLKNDIFIGTNLLLTFESEVYPLNIPQIKKTLIPIFE